MRPGLSIVSAAALIAIGWFGLPSILEGDATAQMPEEENGVTTRVRREGEKVWIEGVLAEEMVRGTFHLDGFPAAMRAVLKFKGVDDKYLSDDTFAAITGQPFRFWFAPDWASCLA